MSRVVFSSTLLWFVLIAGAVAAQRETPPEPDSPPAPAEDGSFKHTPAQEAPPQPEATAPAPEPAAPTSAPAASAPMPAPPAVPPGRYEGQISGDENTPPYEEDLGHGDDPEATSPQRHSNRASFPGFSVRLDPLNLLIDGRLGLELEVVVWDYITVELVPTFVANTKPPAFNFAGRDDPISQHSHGLGPIAGASLGAGFWLSGKPLSGYVLRAILTNYGFTYEAADAAGVFDRVHHTERRLIIYFGSHSRFGAFTISGGIGLGYELNQQERCFVNTGSAQMMVASSGCPDSDELHILLDRDGNQVADLNGGLHPLYLVGRLSLGVAFD